LFLKAREMAGSVPPENEFNSGTSSALDRHRKADDLVQTYVLQQEHKTTFRDRLDDVLLHPFWGYIALVVILYLFSRVFSRWGASSSSPSWRFSIISTN